MKRKVTIKPFRTANGQIDFQMFEGNGKQPTDTLTFDKTKDGMKKSDVYDVEFSLVNAPDTNLIFLDDPNNKNECMWVAKGSKASPPSCPNNGVSDPEFTVDSISDHLLKIQNLDSHECKFKFVLNFVDKGDNNKIVRFDPIYDNKNGGIAQAPMIKLNTATGIVVGIAAVAIIGLAIYSSR